MEWLVVLAVGLVAGTVGGIVGFGTSIMLLPPLVIAFGPKEAVPIMAVTALLANASRAAVWWREIDWKACAVYGATAAPAAALGAATLVAMSSVAIEVALGMFFLFMIPARRMLAASGFRIRLWHLAVVGAVIGFLTGIVASTGPINTPFFLAYGLVKGGFLATEALASLSMYVAKALAFNQLGALPWATFAKGLVVGSSVMLGSYVAKPFVLRLAPERFRVLMDALMLVAGATMIVAALA
ncbi:MAG TPA: sulfite exporter TauE/SafE family protein [Burkholderiales bacterium]|nr:sulfite exporter TauE/SafE family protein [Burkholderiales bacterium]